MKKIETHRVRRVSEGPVSTVVEVECIETPWLMAKEAARYLGISDSFFSGICKEIPYGMEGRARRYNCADLDEFMRNFRLREQAGIHINLPDE